VRRHRSVSLNNEKIYREISEDKIAVCEKTADLQCGNFSDLNSAYLKVLVPGVNCTNTSDPRHAKMKVNNIGTRRTA
jgi:hypothetical protein